MLVYSVERGSAHFAVQSGRGVDQSADRKGVVSAEEEAGEMTKPRPEITGASPRHYDPRVARIAEECRGYKIGMQEKFVTISGSMTKPRPVWANRGFCPSLLMGAGHELAETIAGNPLLHCEQDHTEMKQEHSQV